MYIKYIIPPVVRLMAICLAITVTTPTWSQTLISNNYGTGASIKHLPIERSFIYVPDTAWMYCHHPSVTHFKNKFVAIWSNGMVDEDKPGQRVVFSVSEDFMHWSKPGVVAAPEATGNDTPHVYTAAGLYQFGDTLVAYYGDYTLHRTNTHLWAKYTTDGTHWGEAINLHVPVNANHGPEAVAGGRLIISGNFTLPYTDDHTGLKGWKTVSFYPDTLYNEDNPATFYAPAKKSGLPPLCETSFFQTPNGIIHALLRVTGDGWRGWLWQTESNDNGRHWSLPVQSRFTDNDSKFHFGKLPGGRFYYVGIPDTLHHYERTPLVLSTSANGIDFNKNYIVADEPYILKKEGLWKGGQYGYPHTMVYKGNMYIIVSRQKEAIEILRLKLSDL